MQVGSADRNGLTSQREPVLSQGVRKRDRREGGGSSHRSKNIEARKVVVMSCIDFLTFLSPPEASGAQKEGGCL